MEEKYLFRGKQMENEEWIYGCYICVGGIHFILPKLKSLKDIVCVYGGTIGVYIQKKDKNGKPIFTGDIVKTKYGRICEVYFNKDAMCVDLKPINTPENMRTKTPDSFDLWESENLEVVGNIHDWW